MRIVIIDDNGLRDAGPDDIHAAAFPWRRQTLSICSPLVRRDMVDPAPGAEAHAAAVFRPDIYRRALAGAGLPMPGASMKLEARSPPRSPSARTGGS